MTGNDNTPDVPTWPVLAVELRADGNVRVDGESVPVGLGEDQRTAAVRTVAATAALIGRPVRAEATEPDGTTWPLVVTPDGEVIPAGPGRTPAVPKRRRGVLGRRRAPREQAKVVMTPPPPAPRAEPGPPVPAPPVPTPPAPTPPPDDLPAPEPLGSDPGPPAWPDPGKPARAMLHRIELELRSGRAASATLLAGELVERSRTAAAREVLAYVSFVADQPADAARIYAELALAEPVEDNDGHRVRLSDNARFCLSRVAHTEEAGEIDALVAQLG